MPGPRLTAYVSPLLLCALLLLAAPHVVHHIGQPEDQALACVGYLWGQGLSDSSLAPVDLPSFPLPLCHLGPVPGPLLLLQPAFLAASGRSPPDAVA